MEVIIQGTISALGYLEDGVYYQEPDCYETIRDLIRFLRNDNNVLLARKICGERNIIENDLIPIIKTENLKDKMFDIALRLLANLTQPAIVSLQGKQPEDRDEWQTFWVLEENLRRAKLAFADVKFFSVLKEKLEKYFLETDWEDRLEEDRLVMERIIVLIRYIFSISPTDKDGKRTTAESNSHDRVISAFLESSIDQVLIHIASQSKERDFHLSVLVIFALIVKEHNAEDIVVAGRDRSTAEKEKAEEELREIVENEQSRLNAQRRKILASRHSRFAGSYVVKGLSAVNKEKDLVVVKPIKDVNDLTFLDERKAKKRIAKNRRPFEAQERTHLSSMELRIKLKKFVEDVLPKCFNRLMRSTKELAFDTRLSAGQRNADLHFFLLMTFMLKYTRLAKSASSDVSGCLHVEAFHHVQVHISNYLESAATMRKEAKYYGIRAQYALSAYKELILFHQYLLDNGSPEEKELSHRTCGHILVVEEYREMGLMLMRRFMPGVLSKTFLRDLVLSTHYYFRLLEKSVKSGDLTTVKKRNKVRRRTKRSRKEAEGFGPEPLPAVVDTLSREDLERKWSLVNEELNEVILGNKDASTDQIPINSLLDVEEELHQKFAMLKVQRAMREGRPADAMGLYRRIFGDADIDAEKELSELREIFFTDLKEIADQLLSAELAAQKKFEANSMIDDAGEEDVYSDEDEEEEPKYETKEVNFDFEEYVGKYAKTEVLRWYVFLLNDFATNSAELNKALVKLLHRVAFDLKMPSRLFQLSLFRIFAQVRTQFEGVKKEDMKKSRFFELYTFGYHLLKKFFSCFETLGDKLAPEILFWKGAKECYEIENGYGTYDDSKKHSKEDSAWSWSEELEDELRSLYNEYRDMDERPEGMDVLDFIEPNLSRPRTRKQILSKLKKFGLDPLGAKANKGSIMDRNFPIIQMKQLMEEYNSREDKEDEDLVNFIRTRLAETHGEFSRQKIIKQMNYLGVVYERKKTSSKKYKEWTDGLRTELAGLKQQYEEMDAEDHELIDLVDYVMRRLSEKKPRRQVERELEALGAVIKPHDKPRTTKTRKERKMSGASEDGEDDHPGSYRSENSDAELELEDASDVDKDEGVAQLSQGPKENVGDAHSPQPIVDESGGDNITMGNEVTSNFTADSPIKSAIKRKKRVLASSDEEDNAVEDVTPVEEEEQKTREGDSPVPLKRKKHRVVLSDSDED
ncbi:hypothetical protein ANCCAN_01119 [Ancylostoma caninum]|uniref:Timeless N-terminal domain-containing protein n=1 Tax=Ancylostoma caninum TaxID=29170 RepID=A0A368H808_ANCCA|nr:hypothetical protein ANCCAN_01119 [Ancylostoma caninum]